MEVAVQAQAPLHPLNLEQLSPLPKVDAAITVTVTHVMGNLVLVSCEDKRVGALDLEDTHNRVLKAKKIEVGDTLGVFIMTEDKSGNLLLCVKSPHLDDPWLQRHQVGAEIAGVVDRITADFIQVRFPRSTSGRINRQALSPDVNFDELSASLGINQAIKCKVLGVFSRGSKKLILSLAEGGRS